MSPTTASLISGLVGALIGAGASIATVWVQSRIQDRRERHKLAVDLALQDYKLQLDLAMKTPGKGEIPPVSLFVEYHIGLLRLIDNDNLTPSSYAKLIKQSREFLDAIRKANVEFPR